LEPVDTISQTVFKVKCTSNYVTANKHSTFSIARLLCYNLDSVFRLMLIAYYSNLS
jgi:hypothetical protein